MAEGRNTDLDSNVEIDFCQINTEVRRANLISPQYSKVSVANRDESDDHLKELLPFAEIDCSNNSIARQQFDDLLDTECTHRLRDIVLYDRDNCIDADGDSPLHLAIICEYTIMQIMQIISIIIDIFPYHDVLNHQNKMHRQTPLHLAVLNGLFDTVRLLVGLGAQTTVQDRHLRTPAHIACANGDKESLKALLEVEGNGPERSVRVYDNQGRTCLHITVLNGNTELVKVLIDHGADINAPDRKSGRTALHFAVEAGNTAMIKFLLQYRFTYENLRLDVRTFAGYTALQLAYGRAQTRSDVFELLRPNYPDGEEFNGTDSDEMINSEDNDEVDE